VYQSFDLLLVTDVFDNLSGSEMSSDDGVIDLVH